MQFKVGDLVTLKKAKDFPDCGGSLVAVKFYNRLLVECQDKPMLIIKTFDNDSSSVVLVSGYRKVINNKFLKIANIIDSEELHEFKKI